MSWTDYAAPTADIPLGGDATGRVRGLNLDDISILVTDHLPAITKAVTLYAASKGDVYTKTNIHAFVIQVASEFPTLLSEVISLAADEPALKGRKIAMGVQIAALTEIVRLTLEELGGLGNLSLVVANLAKGVLSGQEVMRTPATEVRTSSLGSFGVSEKT